MALDTRDKRASAIAHGLAFGRLLPEPGTLTEADFEQIAFLYAGIQAEDGVAATRRPVAPIIFQ